MPFCHRATCAEATLASVPLHVGRVPSSCWWKDGWVEGLIGGFFGMGEWMDLSHPRFRDPGWVGGWMEGWMDRWMGGKVGGWMNVRIGGRMGEWMDEWMDWLDWLMVGWVYVDNFAWLDETTFDTHKNAIELELGADRVCILSVQRPTTELKWNANELVNLYKFLNWLWCWVWTGQSINETINSIVCRVNSQANYLMNFQGGITDGTDSPGLHERPLRTGEVFYQHSRKILIVGILVLCLGCLGLQTVTTETDVESLFIQGKFSHSQWSCLVTGIDLSKILPGQTKILGGKGGNNWWMHEHFSSIGGVRPGCPPQSLCLCD